MNDRQKELETNALATAIGEIDKSIQPYKRLIAVIVGAIVIGVLALVFFSVQASEQRSDATLQLIQADGDAEVLASVSSNYPDTVAARWAKLYQGNEYLGEGLAALYSNRENAMQLLEDSKAAFTKALDGSDDSLLLSRAHFGLARAHESLGDLDYALAEYEKTIAANESDEMVKLAERRIERLNSPGTKDFLAWFADQDFSPAEPSLPPKLPRSKSLPDLPDLDLPKLELPGLDVPGGEDSDVMEKEGGLELPEENELEKTSADSTESVQVTEEALKEGVVETSGAASDESGE